MAVSAVNYADGNNNSPEYNEYGSFNVTFQNIGAEPATNVTATLSSATAGITITDASETIASLAAGASTTVNNAFAISIADGIADGTSAAFTITMASGTESWTHTFNLTLNAPQLSFGSMTISDPAPGNNNGTLDPGETVTVSVSLHNNGAAASPSGTAVLSSPTPGITINSGSASFSAISAAGSALLAFSLTASESIGNGTLAQLGFNASAGAYTANATEYLEVGAPTEIIIGSGTSNQSYPLDRYYNYSAHEAIYLASEIGTGGLIQSMAYYKASGTDLNTITPVTVYMKNTTATSLSTGTYSTAGYTQVYSGTWPNNSTSGWMEIDLDTQFMHDGSSSLAVLIVKGYQAWISAYPRWNYSTSPTTRARQARDDYSQPSSLTASNNLPNLRLKLFPGTINNPAIVVSPISLAYGTVNVGSSSVQQFTVQNTGTETLTGTVTTPAGFSVALGSRYVEGSFSLSDQDDRNTLSINVAAGASQSFDLTFAPTAATSYSGNVVLSTNAANSPTVNVAVSGMGLQMPNDPRFVAEWEPAKGALVRYPFGLPYSLLADMSNNGLLYVLVTSSSQSTCNSSLTSNGVNMANVRYINTSTDSYWTRDYGPWTIFEADNSMKIVDFTYNRPRPNDDASTAAVASYLGYPKYDMPINHTGGNIMTDGNGKAMSTELVLEENATLTQSQIEQMFQNYLGITEYQLYEDPNNTYIDHIDCWAKLLDVDKVLIRSVPSSHAQYGAIEAVVDVWESKTSSYGTPYRIYRVYTPNNEPYSNSYIMNKRVYVPQMGTANDSAALAAYQDALPGYNVLGYSYSSFESTDAIHCRVNTIFDDQMVHLWHLPLSTAMANSTVPIEVQITHANPLDPAQTYVAYRHGGGGNWLYAPLTFVSGNTWTASVPTPAFGQTLYYYILATDTTARNATQPLCAALDPFTLLIDQQGENTPPTIALPDSFSFAMNGSLVVDFSPYVDDADGDPLTLAYTGNTNVQVSITGLSVTFNATADWFGTELLTFTVSDGTDSAEDSVSIVVNLDYLAVPEITITELDPATLRIQWNAIPNSLSYEVWACDEPYGTYLFLGRTASLFWDDIVTDQAKRFYKVIATDVPMAKNQ
ncbi:MAG: agmatine deiminase family protein [Candidatus Syntrophosphaera sp.]|nr:agmatine deiminase family protein [Candidatus Syntrophosphaera sp.]